MPDPATSTTPLRWALRFAWRAEPRLCNLLAVSTLAASLLPAATTLTIGFVVAAAYRALRASTDDVDLRPAAVWFGLSLLLMLLQGAAAALRRYAELRLGDILNLELSSRILDHAATLDLAFFEDPESQDVLSRAASDPGGSFLRFFVAASNAACSAVLCLSLAGVLLWVDWLAAPGLILVAVPFVVHHWRLGRERFVLERARTRRQRWAGYYLGLVTQREQVAETRMLGLAPLLRERFRERLVSIHDDLTGLYAPGHRQDPRLRALPGRPDASPRLASPALASTLVASRQLSTSPDRSSSRRNVSITVTSISTHAGEAAANLRQMSVPERSSRCRFPVARLTTIARSPSRRQAVRPRSTRKEARRYS